MYVQITPNIIQALGWLTNHFEIEITTGKKDVINLRVLFPKADCDKSLIKSTIRELINRFDAKQEMLHNEPIVWDRGGYLVHFFILQSTKIEF